MKKLCAKQNRRTKLWEFLLISQTLRNVFAIFANFAMDCEFGNGLRIWQCGLRSWQSGCEFGKAIANLARWFANLAMRNFAKLLKFYVRSEVRKGTVQWG